MQNVSAQAAWQGSEFHRTPQTVMRLSRMGSAHQSRLSFMRTLLRRMKRENWQFERSLFEINDQGVGRAVYQAKGPRRTYSLVAFAHDLPDDLRLQLPMSGSDIVSLLPFASLVKLSIC